MTDDALTLLGVDVDGAVRRVHTDYDGQGNAYLMTNYSAATGGAVVSQVRRSFNGLGQLLTEYQAHGAAVDTSHTDTMAKRSPKGRGNRRPRLSKCRSHGWRVRASSERSVVTSRPTVGHG